MIGRPCRLNLSYLHRTKARLNRVSCIWVEKEVLPFRDGERDLVLEGSPKRIGMAVA